MDIFKKKRTSATLEQAPCTIWPRQDSCKVLQRAHYMRCLHCSALSARCLLCPSSQTLGYNFRITATEAGLKKMVFFHGKNPNKNKKKNSIFLGNVLIFSLFFFFW